jgi:hypothetical protein
VFRFEPATQASESSWSVLPGPHLSSGGDALGVGDEVTPDDVAESTLERADRFAGGVTLGALAVLVVAAGAVAVPDLG